METKELKEMVRSLAMVNETNDPFVSCYINMKDPDWENTLEANYQKIRRSLSSDKKTSFEQSYLQIKNYLKNEILENTEGVALFSRSGEDPYFKTLQFLVPLENFLSADTLPSIYHLVEMKDTYHRFVIVLSNKNSVRILEVNLGKVTEAIWTEKPELKERIGREWTKMHYQNHRKDRNKKHYKEKIKILNQLMSQGGYKHLIIAGQIEAANAFKRQLPKNLSKMLIELVNISDKDELSTIVPKTLDYFIDKEKEESISSVENLKETVIKGGLAVCGPEASLKALKNGQVDKLIISQEIKDKSMREELIKLASLYDCQIETVSKNKELMKIGGVGCLLRYALPYHYENLEMAS